VVLFLARFSRLFWGLARSGLKGIFRYGRSFGPPASRNEKGGMATIITSEQQFVCGVYVYAKYSNGPRYSLPLFPLLPVSFSVPLPRSTHTHAWDGCGQSGQGANQAKIYLQPIYAKVTNTNTSKTKLRLRGKKSKNILTLIGKGMGIGIERGGSGCGAGEGVLQILHYQLFPIRASERC